MKHLPLSSVKLPVTDPKVLQRWEKRSTFNDPKGIWGQYLGVKAQKVFPDLKLDDCSAVIRPSTRHLIEVKKDE
jgi:hypothetical protein